MGLFIFIAYSIRTIRNTLYHIAWWETKEYRPDRMKVHLTETVQGKQWMFGWLSLCKWVLLALYALPLSAYLDWIVFGLYGFEAGKILLEHCRIH